MKARIAIPVFLAAAAIAVSGAPVRGHAAARTAESRKIAPPRPLSHEETKILAVQIKLARAGFSTGCIDGTWGRRTAAALATKRACAGLPPMAGEGGVKAAIAAEAGDLSPAAVSALFRTETVTAADIAALVRIPKSPAAKARLPGMGYESILEMFAERGRCSKILLRRLNPRLRWPDPPPGTRVIVPDVHPAHDGALAVSLRISISRREITAFDATGRMIAYMPCSIAADKAKILPAGELTVTSLVPNPDYTYDGTMDGASAGKLVFPPGPNSPVGTAWIGLSRKGFGMHGTPRPERIGGAESHGCFRLTNWDAERLLAVCAVGTPVAVEE